MNNNLKPQLLILAAGMGSRYGGPKQLEAFGPNGETIMEYSIYDAIRAGFKKIVFVINKQLEAVFNQKIISKFLNRIELDYVCQEPDHLPSGYSLPIGRKKPWGTGHAILTARNIISEPFAVINADDFYGSNAFRVMKETLSHMESASSEFYLLGYVLSNTLSKHGSVCRGVCHIENGFLSSITERVDIRKTENILTYQKNGKTFPIDPESIVSMNFWGFSPKVFDIFENQFRLFLQEKLNDTGAEFFIANPLDFAIRNGSARVKLLTTYEKWLGITHLEDKPIVLDGIFRQIKEGVYPTRL